VRSICVPSQYVGTPLREAQEQKAASFAKLRTGPSRASGQVFREPLDASTLTLDPQDHKFARTRTIIPGPL
jgi:hypothetical protein